MATISEALAIAVQHHQAGRLQEAEQIYRELLGADPNCAEAWNLLGVLAAQTGQYRHAVPLIERALELRPDRAEFHFNLGFALHGQGNLDAAGDAYRQALQLDPNHTRALNNLGNLLGDRGELEEAIGCHRRARDLSPESADAHFNLANNLKAVENWEEAIACYRRALELNPNWAEAHSNLGDALQGHGDGAVAIASYRRALELMPDSPQILSNLGSALAGQGEVDEALGYIRRAIELMPDLVTAHLNLGSTLQKKGCLEEAVLPLREAMRLNPNSARAHNALGLLQRDRGYFEEAVRCFQRSISLDSRFSAAHTNYAMMLLSEGRFEEGWLEYEWRWKSGDLSPRAFVQPSWQGEPLGGKAILLHAEQGLGDTLQFVRYASLVKELGATVVVECQKPLVSILRSCAGVDRVVAQGDELPAFDVHAPLLSLPRLLKTTLASVPANVPYVFADPALVDLWRTKLAGLKRLRVGIHWRGRTGVGMFRQRDIPLEFFSSLADDRVDFVSLQKDAQREELPAAIDDPVYFPGDDFDQTHGPFMDTAAIIRNLDLVITSDTSLPHLAGALGAPVWIALPYVASWQWMRDRPHSPWYPTARLFRQKRPGDWSGVFDEICAALIDYHPQSG